MTKYTQAELDTLLANYEAARGALAKASARNRFQKTIESRAAEDAALEAHRVARIAWNNAQYGQNN